MYSSTGDNSAKLTFFTEGTERMLIGSTGRIPNDWVRWQNSSSP